MADDGRLHVWGCGTPRTLRVYWALRELELDFVAHPVRTRTSDMDAGDFLAVSPGRKIPGLSHGGFTLVESGAIVDYLYRLAGADANPYLAIAASLACGYLGMIQKLKPRSPVEGSAYRLAHTLPRTLYDALSRFNSSRAIKPVLGEKFIDAVTIVKETELLAYQKVISSWEREHLLLNV